MNEAPQAVFVYITTKDKDEAVKIAKKAVSERLAACANIIDQMSSIYWWEGEIQQDQECVLILKTRQNLVVELTEMVRHVHSYDCPCIVALPIEGGNDAYLAWIRQQTNPEPQSTTT